MPSHSTSGVAGYWTFTPQNPSSAAGMSMAAVFYRNAQGVLQQVSHIKAGTSGDQASIRLAADNTLAGLSSSTPSASTIAVPFQTWCFAAWTKATGSSTMRLHLYDYTARTWTHQNSSTGATNSWGGTGTMTGRHAAGDGVDHLDGFIDCVGIFQKELSDAEIEQLPFAWTNWLAQSSALHLWRFDRYTAPYPAANTATQQDWTGNGALVTPNGSNVFFYSFSDSGTTLGHTGFCSPLQVGASLITTSRNSAAAEVTGTLAETLDNATSAASGASGAAGTVARTTANTTSAAAGASGAAGTTAQTLAAVTSAASGSTVTGTVARTLANVTSAASGASGASGTVAVTLANVTTAASGTHAAVGGAVARTLADVTSTASGYQVYPLNETFPGASGAPGVWWTTSVVGTATIGLDTNRLKVTVPALADAAQALLTDVLPANVELKGDYTYTVLPAQTVGFNFRGDGVWQSSGNRHLFTNGLAIVPIINTGQVRLYSTVASVSTQVGASLTLAIGATDTIHFHVLAYGTSVLWKAWLNATPEPSAWESTTDSTHNARTRFGLGLQNPFTSSPVTAYWDNVTANDASATGTVAATLANVTSVAAGAAGGASGTVARTLAAITGAITGNAVATGTVARTLANVTAAASGGSSTAGTVARTLDPVVVQATGGFGAIGSVAATLANVTSAASGSVGNLVSGTVARTLDAVETAAPLTDEFGDPITDESGNPILVYGAEGSHGIGGTVARTLANITSAATGGVAYAGSLAETLDDLTSTAAGTSGQTGTLARTLAALTSTASGVVGASGSLAETLDNTTSSAAGTHDPIVIAGNLSVTLAAITSAASGSSVAGIVTETLDDATGVAAATFTIAGSLAVTLAPVTSTTVGAPGTTGTVDRTLADVLGAGEGSSVSGTVDETLDDIESTTSGNTTITVLGVGRPRPVFSSSRIRAIFVTGRIRAIAGSRR